MEMKKAFLSLPEEETFKYFDIFKHTLSGTIGKNLINMEFPLDQEVNGGTQEFLMKLKNSKLQDDLLLEEFYDKVVESYEYGENYYIILIHAVYDVPGKTKDGLEMEDASDTVYEHILCSICPVNLTKAGLTYNAQTNNIEDRIRDWFVETPGSCNRCTQCSLLHEETRRITAIFRRTCPRKYYTSDCRRPEDNLPGNRKRHPW